MGYFANFEGSIYNFQKN